MVPHTCHCFLFQILPLFFMKFGVQLSIERIVATHSIHHYIKSSIRQYWYTQSFQSVLLIIYFLIYIHCISVVCVLSICYQLCVITYQTPLKLTSTKHNSSQARSYLYAKYAAAYTLTLYDTGRYTVSIKQPNYID